MVKSPLFHNKKFVYFVLLKRYDMTLFYCKTNLSIIEHHHKSKNTYLLGQTTFELIFWLFIDFPTGIAKIVSFVLLQLKSDVLILAGLKKWLNNTSNISWIKRQQEDDLHNKLQVIFTNFFYK